MKKIYYKEIIEIVCRLYVFFFLTIYGLGKVIGAQFYTAARMPDGLDLIPIGQVSDFDLAWVFMGRSFGYMLFIGLAEIFGAFLLLFNKTKLIGSLVLIPIMVNVIVFDIFFLDEYGALAGATLYLLMLLTILIINKEKISKLLIELVSTNKVSKISFKEKLIKYSIVLVIIILIFIGDQFIVNFFGHGKG
ncbi:hypothetical protein OD91_0132 [Lutibacter sp. Hel_I_33_5]|uniref:hypothetical protein n=1 Tax=Lutibacter sp. Hel_I_33_5 TaxID=1566289 RepID=UPI00119CBFE5|nr:hypothetical protein [Lutibacter sp. Hel_I_33_5]TVZ54895.1 hypothetical protein OD91_0132 [Lutibacter sp. Hel_I_33_5]